MKRMFALVVIGAALIGYIVGHATRPASQPVVTGHFDDLSVVQHALAQSNKPPVTHWSIDDIKKAHAEMAEKASKLLSQPGSGSSQSFGGGPVAVSTRNFSMFMLYRVHRDQPVLSLTKVNSVWDDAEQHAGAYDFYVFTGGSGQMIVGGKIENRKNLIDKDGPVPGEYRGQPVVGAQTFNVKTGDWLLIPPDTPHQPKPDTGGFSYMIMKINVGIYPWNLIR